MMLIVEAGPPTNRQALDDERFCFLGPLWQTKTTITTHNMTCKRGERKDSVRIVLSCDEEQKFQIMKDLDNGFTILELIEMRKCSPIF